MFENNSNINLADYGFLNGSLNINDQEISYMVDIYAQFGAGYNAKLNKTILNKKIRGSLGDKLWEEMTNDERKREFFAKLKEDLEFTSKYILENNKINYFLDRALDPLDPMSGFYTLLLVKMGATITEDGKIKVTNELKERLERNILNSKQSFELPQGQSNQNLQMKTEALKLSLKLRLE